MSANRVLGILDCKYARNFDPGGKVTQRIDLVRKN